MPDRPDRQLTTLEKALEINLDSGLYGTFAEIGDLFLDAGLAVHPSYVEGQMQGGTVQGLGWALNEEYVFLADGTMANGSFLDYRMPTCLDVPMIETVILEVPNPRHPFGLRGVGEAPIIPPLAAVANAIYQATGVRMEQLPMSPGNVLEALHAKQKDT